MSMLPKTFWYLAIIVPLLYLLCRHRLTKRNLPESIQLLIQQQTKPVTTTTTTISTLSSSSMGNYCSSNSKYINNNIIATTPPKNKINPTTDTTKITSATNQSNNMTPLTSSILAVGAGCYWGTEKYIVKDFQKKYPGSIANAKVGFMSPHSDAMKNPTYRQVCSGSTGHVEVLNIELSKTHSTDEVFEELCKFLFMFHDPTTLNRQGNDVGTQYSSIIFCSSPDQHVIANKVKDELQTAIDTKRITAYQGRKVETGIVDYTTFYEAHEEHQEYLTKNPNGYCNHRYRFKEWPTLN